MLAPTYVRFAAPVTLNLRAAIPGEQHPPQLAEFGQLPLVTRLDAVARTITAHLPPIPGGLLLYGPADFVAACPDEPEDFAARVLQCLGTDPAASLQSLIDGTPLPAAPPRVPREIANWRAKATLAAMGKLPAVEAVIAALPEPQRTVEPGRTDIVFDGTAFVFVAAPELEPEA